MRIAVDIEPFFRNRAGVGRYVEGVLGSLTRIEEADEYTLFRSRTYSGSPGVPGLAPGRAKDVVLPYSHKGLRLRWLLANRPRVEKFAGAHDLWFSPGPPAFPTAGRMVVVMHDMNWLKFPRFYPRYSVRLRRVDFRRSVRRAAGILTVSEWSRRDILEASGLEESRVRAVYNGLDPAFFLRPSEAEISAALDRLGVRRPYVLAVAGDNSPKKNLPNLVRAVARLPKEFAGTMLVNVGRPRYDQAGFEGLVSELGLSERVKAVGRVADDDLRALYAGAELTAYPSLYEGFGFPIVESMAAGTPVVTSNTSSMPEVAGDAALLVDPADPGAISGAIRSLLADPALRAGFAAKGLERAKRFRWETCARATRDFFAEMIRD